jgi:death on curing protein
MRFAWIDAAVVRAIHDEQLSEHGGSAGLRDEGLLESALGRPQNLASYGKPDVAACAASYGFGLARNHPFLDGNKRSAFVAVELFLDLNAFALEASDADCVITMLQVAEGSMSEEDFAGWIRRHTRKKSAK